MLRKQTEKNKGEGLKNKMYYEIHYKRTFERAITIL